MNYYYLISGLPDIVPERRPQYFDITSWIEEIMESLDAKDRKYVHQLFLPYDHQNISHLLLNNDERFDPKGSHSFDYLKENLSGNADDTPDYMKDIIEHFQLAKENNDETLNLSRFAWQRFYQTIEETCDNDFLRKWFAFDKILRNIQSAWMSKRLGIDVQKELVGLEEELEVFVKSVLPDYGLRREIPLGEEIFNLLEEDVDILEREHRFDLIRWKIVDELTTFNYFDINVVLAFLIKADILDRWLKLDPTKGKEKFDKIVNKLIDKK